MDSWHIWPTLAAEVSLSVERSDDSPVGSDDDSTSVQAKSDGAKTPISTPRNAKEQSFARFANMFYPFR
jgi:hypothetical protein